MKRIAALLFALLLAENAFAEDSVSVVGNYFKERSTRVYEPIVHVEKEVPGIVDLEGTFAVDNVTSASGAVTPTDRIIHEFREEAQLALRHAFGSFFKPGLVGRISYEPDYTSGMLGADARFSFGRDTTVLKAFFQHQRDAVRARGSNNFKDKLATSVVGVAASQILLPNLIVGVSGETQILRGFQENFYRVETHPRARNRFAASGFAAYHFEPTATTARLSYRFYGDSWKLFGHTIDLELTQEILASVEVSARFRYYTQDDVYFADGRGTYSTMDPKLTAFDSQLYGIGLRFGLTFLGGRDGTGVLARSSIEPRYQLLDQHNIYGIAHIAQLGWTIPF